MNKAIQTFLDAAQQLPESDRLEIAQRLLASLPNDYEDGIAVGDPGFLNETERRAKKPVMGIPWKDIYAEG